MKDAAIAASAMSLCAGATSVTPNGAPSRAHRRRHRKGAHIEQIGKARVRAEPAVVRDRIGSHLRDGINCRRGRQHHRIDIAERVVAQAAQILELIEAANASAAVPCTPRRTGRPHRQALYVDVVLDGHRNAVERQGRLAGLLQSARFGKSSASSRGVIKIAGSSCAQTRA